MKELKVKTASRVETEIDAEIDYLTRRLQRRDQFGSMKEAITAGVVQAEQALLKLEDLLDIKFEIREAKAKFNREKGINDRTIKIAKLKAKLAMLESAENLSDASEGYSRGEGKVYDAGITEQLREGYRSEARKVKRRLQEITDSCNGINSNGYLEITMQSFTKLQKYGMLD